MRTEIGLICLLVMFTITSTAHAQSFGTFFTEEGDVIELSRTPEGELNGSLTRLLPGGEVASATSVTGLNVTPGELVLQTQESEQTIYRRRSVQESDAFGEELYTEWVSTSGEPVTLPNSFRSLLQAETANRIKTLADLSYRVAEVDLDVYLDAQDALINYFRTISPELDFSEVYANQPILIETDRSTISWLQAARRSDNDHQGTRLAMDTVGTFRVIGRVEQSLLPAIRTAAITQAKPGSLQLARVPSVTVPPQAKSVIELRVPVPNFMTKYRDSNWFKIPYPEIDLLFDAMSVGPCGIEESPGYFLLAECFYFSGDIGIGDARWFRTAMYFVLGNDDGNVSAINVFPMTLTAPGSREQYDALLNATWGIDANFETRTVAENYLQSRLALAVRRVYAHNP